ncbi:MAG: amidohydrolase family protein [Vicinamibacterales bacterium]
MICDAHVHFFSPGFFDALGAQKGLPAENRVGEVALALEWEAAPSVAALADRWVAELDAHGVSRAALIASLPGDEASVAAAVAAYPYRFVGFFMLDPTREDALDRVAWAIAHGLRGICLFPAMHRYPLYSPDVSRIFDLAAASPGTAVFVHCGVLAVGARKKLGLPSPFELRFGNPLDLQGVVHAHPRVPVIIPHFGAGMFREALMLAQTCSSVHLDTSSSNAWMRYTPGLTLAEVFRTALEVAGPERLIFGTDSSFFPRGWQAWILNAQVEALAAAGVTPDQSRLILGQNFARLFPVLAGDGD